MFGSPKLKTEDLRWEAGVESDGSLAGVFITRDDVYDPDDAVGEVEGRDGGKCIDCEDDLRKKGIEDGVSLFVDPRRTEASGLRGACGSEGAEAVWFVLTLDAVTGRLAELSGVLAARI